jgi:hypothetical protein
MPLQQLPVTGLDDINHQRRHREITNKILTHQFDDSKVRTAAEIAAGVTPVNYAYPPGHAWRYMASDVLADVIARTKTKDTRSALQASIDVAQTSPGGRAIWPAGGYLINRDTVTVPADGQHNGLVVRYTNVFGYAGSGLVIETDGQSTTLYAGDNSMTVIRWSEGNGQCQSLTIDGNSKTGVTGLSLIGSNTSSTTLAENINHNSFWHLNIVGCAEGVEFESPSAGGCYYNKFFGGRSYNNTRHLRFRDNATKGGANRNFFFGYQLIGGNCGVWNDGADTLAFIGCTSEDISTGTSPCATPTVFKTLVGTLASFLPQLLTLVGWVSEACSRDLDLADRRVYIAGGTIGANGMTGSRPDYMVSGESSFRIRELLFGDETADGLALVNRITSFANYGSSMVGSSADQGATFPFNNDGSLVLKSRAAVGSGIALVTGASPTLRLKIDGSGHIGVTGTDFAIGESASAPGLTNSATISTAFKGVSRCSASGNVTGLILEAGTQDGQLVIVRNESAFTLTFAAAGTSHVADGTSDVIAANTSGLYNWSTANALWSRC